MAIFTSKKLSYYKWLCQICSPAQFNNKPVPPAWQSDRDWGEIIFLSSIHGVLPQLYRQLEHNHYLHFLPKEVVQALEGFSELNHLFNARLREQVFSTTLELNAHGIEPIWLKGACQLLMPNWQSSPRTMLDLDLWIPNPEEQLQTLKILDDMGYFIQPESVGLDYSQSQHYAPVIRLDQPARLEIHKNIVSPFCSELLPDEDVQQQVIWKSHDELNYGVLSIDDQIMQAFLQCTEQATDCMNPRTTPRIMKIIDFLQRFESRGQLTQWFISNSAIAQVPWLKRTAWLSTLLQEYFSVQTPIPQDLQYLRRIQFTLAMPRADGVLGIFERGYRLLLTGKLGKAQSWPGKLKRQFAALKNIR